MKKGPEVRVSCDNKRARLEWQGDVPVRKCTEQCGLPAAILPPRATTTTTTICVAPVRQAVAAPFATSHSTASDSELQPGCASSSVSASWRRVCYRCTSPTAPKLSIQTRSSAAAPAATVRFGHDGSAIAAEYGSESLCTIWSQ